MRKHLDAEYAKDYVVPAANKKKVTAKKKVSGYVKPRGKKRLGRRVQVVFPEKGLTKQSFKEECDVNNIVDTFLRTGIVLGQNKREAQYGEAPDQTLFEAACVQAELRSKAEEGVFEETPSEPDEGEKEASEAEPRGDAEKSLDELSDAESGDSES